MAEKYNIEAYLVTWATYNSRYSIKKMRNRNLIDIPFILNDKFRVLVYKYLKQKIAKEQYCIEDLNVLSDHVHCIIECKNDTLDEIVGGLKGYSSFQLGRKLDLSEEGKGRQNKI
jgi:REP element-mobilizing transposase RayT